MGKPHSIKEEYVSAMRLSFENQLIIPLEVSSSEAHLNGGNIRALSLKTSGLQLMQSISAYSPEASISYTREPQPHLACRQTAITCL